MKVYSDSSSRCFGGNECLRKKDPGAVAQQVKDPEYVEYNYEKAGVTIQIPFALKDLTPEETDTGIVFKDPEGKWLIRFAPLSYARKKSVLFSLSTMFEEDGSGLKDNNVSSVSVDTGEYGSSGYKYYRYTWAMDIENKPSRVYRLVTAYPHIVEVVDYGQYAVGEYSGMLVEVTTPDGLDEAGSLNDAQFYQYSKLKEQVLQDFDDSKLTREQYPDVADIDTEITRRFVDNMRFVEGVATRAVSIDGVELELPAYWEQHESSKTEELLVYYNGSEVDGGYVDIGPYRGKDPMYAAEVATSRATDVDKASAEVIRTRFEELKAEGLMREYTVGENVFYGAYIQSLNQLGFYTLFTEENCLSVRLSMNGEPTPEQLWQFADSEIFQNILRSMKIEVTAYIPTAEDLELEKDFEINASGVLYKYNGSASEIRLPKRVNGILVESMSSGLFNGNTAITKVVFPSGFPNVGQDAFAGCTNLTQVELAEGIKDIGGRAFDGCTALKEITLPSTLEHVGAYAFQGSGIETLHIPGSLKVIGNRAFA